MISADSARGIQTLCCFLGAVAGLLIVLKQDMNECCACCAGLQGSPGSGGWLRVLVMRPAAPLQGTVVASKQAVGS